MALFLRSNHLTAILLVLLLCQLLYASGSVLVKGEEEFSEELLLKPLPDRKVLAHFHFETRAPPSNSHGRHHHLFPKAIAQLVKKLRVKEMELSFTQGRWRYEQWGGYDTISSNNAKPPGVELWAVFDVPQSLVDASWRNLTHTLSGLFCASINFLESSTAYSDPEWTFQPSLGKLRYGTLPREAVCTENLTPWLKLLPCRDKAGLSALMDRPSIYRGFYHSQRLRLTSSESGLNGVDSGIILEQTLTVVLQPNSRTGKIYSGKTNIQPSWSISSIFGRKVSGKCVLSKTSNVYFHIEKGLISELENLQKKNTNSGADKFALEGFSSNLAFELSVTPDKMFEEVDNLDNKSASVLYEFSIEKYSDSQPFDLGLTWKIPVVWSTRQGPLHASRFLMGSGNQRGAIAISLESTELNEDLPNIDGGCELRVDIFQVVPWYIKVYFHTLRVFLDQKPRAVADVIEKIRVSPSKDKVSPGVMEMILKLPCGTKSAALTLEFDKGFLHIDEYPPDANQGYDIPSAVISFPNFDTRMHLSEDVNKSPMLSKFQEKSPVLSYTEILLVPLTTPDFSMPYNVITITCTVFALYFGSLLNVLRKRVGEEERLLKSRAGQKTGRISQLLSKLSAKLRGKQQEQPQLSAAASSFISFKLVFKILLVAGIAVAWQYFWE
ncbi:GPI transamidase component PIG-T [Melia azedarach]|uniref:GPI transamidase component PIG-T n=1 Tax=Melia azedarach TaxID=155640 RepID=A0ACC1YZI6_MELAZ|nr:GPI transamidase component PIG-T [Melia azedarach]